MPADSMSQPPECPNCGSNEHIGVNGFSNTGSLTYRVEYVCQWNHMWWKPSEPGKWFRVGWEKFSINGKMQNFPS